MTLSTLHASPADAIKAMHRREQDEFVERTRRIAHRMWPGIGAATNGAYDSDDIAREAIRRVLRGRITWGKLARGPGSPEAKLYSVMFYQVKKVGTKWYRASDTPLKWPDAPNTEHDDPISRLADPLEHREFLEELCADDPDALRLALYYSEGRSPQRSNTAEALGWSPKRVTNTVRRLKRRLQDWRTEEDDEEE